MKEEINVDEKYVKELYLNGISESTRRFNRPALVFTALLSISSDEVKKLYNKGPEDSYESYNVVVLTPNEFKQLV